MSQQPRAPELPGIDEYQRLLILLDERRFDEALVRGRLLLESGTAGPLVRAKTHNLICWTLIEGLKRASPEAVLNGEEAVALAAALGERSLMLQAQFNLASAYYQMGDYTSARAVYKQLLGVLSADPTAVPCGQVIALQGLAQLDLVEGCADQALAHLDKALTLCQEDEAGFLQAELHRRRTLALLKLDRVAEAAEALSRVDENACAPGPRTLWWKTHLGFTRVRVELAQKRVLQARPLAQNAFALARELNDLPVLAECTCLLALIEWAEGRKEAPRRARLALTYAIQSGRRDVVDDIRARMKEILGDEL